MLTVIIPHIGDQVGLAQLLVNLQPQLNSSDDIYILDMSSDRSGVKIAKRYGSARCFIFVEPTNKPDYEALQFGFQSMRENKQEGALVIYPDVIIAHTFIANLKKAIKQGYDMLLFNQLESPEMDPNFKWFTPPPIITTEPSQDNAIYAYYMKASVMMDELSKYESCKVGFIESEHIAILS